jgi:fructokinase
MPAKHVLSIGEVLIDIIVDDGATSLETAEHFAARPGGAPANVAVALARLGVPAAFCGAVGDDPFGVRLRNELAKNDVDTACLTTITGANTTLAFAWKDAQGDGFFRILRMADLQLDDAQIDAATIADRAAIVLGSVGLTDEPSRSAIHRAVRQAAKANVPIIFDVNIRASLWESAEAARVACHPILDRATILKLSIDDARFLFELDDPAAIFALRGARDRIVLITDGARGAWFRDETGEVQHVPAHPVEAVEPTGAGDAFNAAIISRYLASGKAPNRDDVVFAAAAGAITATRIGAIASLPYFSEIEAFLGHR